MDLQRPQPALSYSNCLCSGSGLHPLFPGCYNNIPISYLFYLSHLTKKSMFTTLKIVHSIPCSKSKILHFRDFLLLNSILLSNLISHMFISDIFWLSHTTHPSTSLFILFLGFQQCSFITCQYSTHPLRSTCGRQQCGSSSIFGSSPF